MNWKRGLFRLWAVAAVLWIVGTMWLQWREIRCDWEPSRQGCNASDQWAVVAQTPIDLSKLSDAQVRALHDAGGDFTKLTDEMRKSILTSLGAGGGWQADPIVSTAPPRYDKLMNDAGPILGPPLLLLLVGGLLYWAIRGFRRAAD
ncbi:MAG: hypothetical protein QOJ15_8140 [Bradyrhizobium sp.]|nr:hypothetical protein [Bradyrhizobium sp.]